jgi:hypothetical protein
VPRLGRGTTVRARYRYFDASRAFLNLLAVRALWASGGFARA